MKKVAERSTGMGLNIMKFHAITHLMDDILAFGVPLEFDTAANESHHKPAKHAARLTQRNEDTFQWQVAQRMFEFHTLEPGGYMKCQQVQRSPTTWMEKVLHLCRACRRPPRMSHQAHQIVKNQGNQNLTRPPR